MEDILCVQETRGWDCLSIISIRINFLGQGWKAL